MCTRPKSIGLIIGFVRIEARPCTTRSGLIGSTTACSSSKSASACLMHGQPGFADRPDHQSVRNCFDRPPGVHSAREGNKRPGWRIERYECSNASARRASSAGSPRKRRARPRKDPRCSRAATARPMNPASLRRTSLRTYNVGIFSAEPKIQILVEKLTLETEEQIFEPGSRSESSASWDRPLASSRRTNRLKAHGALSQVRPYSGAKHAIRSKAP